MDGSGPEGDAETVTESVLFPDLALFEEPGEIDDIHEPHVLSPWAKTKIGTFQARLETVLKKRDMRGMGKYGMASVSSALLINMVNECFGFNGWSSRPCESRFRTARKWMPRARARRKTCR
ncbi:hypothetical protein OXX69_005105 [Metschnikowia pulcherrima]